MFVGLYESPEWKCGFSKTITTVNRYIELCNPFLRFRQSILSDCKLFPRFRQSFSRIAIRSLDFNNCNPKERNAIRENGLSNSME